jgi:hypothetical protein
MSEAIPLFILAGERSAMTGKRERKINATYGNLKESFARYW